MKNYDLTVIKPADLMNDDEMANLVGGGCLIKIGTLTICICNEKGKDKSDDPQSPQPKTKDEQSSDSTTIKTDSIK